MATVLLICPGCGSDERIDAAREWQTLLATSLDDPLWTPLPVDGPTGTPVAVSAAADTARIWTFEDNQWGVSQTVALDDQFVDELGGELPTSMAPRPVIVVDPATKYGVRFLLPTSYANGPAVSAIGYNEGWALLLFRDEHGERRYAPDAEIIGGEIVVWHNSCLFGCAETDPVQLSVTPASFGYQVASPPPPSTLPANPQPGDRCIPGSLPDCTDNSEDGMWRLIDGWQDCLANLSEGLCTDLDGDGRAGYPDRG